MKKIIAYIVILLMLAPVCQAKLAAYQQNFIVSLVPKIRMANQTVRLERQSVFADYKAWRAHDVLSLTQRHHLLQLAHAYHVQSRPFEQAWWTTLLRRVDIIPASLIIAQAINESNWGRSRFARDGNNLFGIWCYQKGCGIVPKRRPQGQHYEVKRFVSVLASIKAYLRNLNVSAAYLSLRQKRAASRRAQQSLSSLQLVKGLTRYSSKGSAYIKALSKSILLFQLQRFDAAS